MAPLLLHVHKTKVQSRSSVTNKDTTQVNEV